MLKSLKIAMVTLWKSFQVFYKDKQRRNNKRKVGISLCIIELGVEKSLR